MEVPQEAEDPGQAVDQEQAGDPGQEEDPGQAEGLEQAGDRVQVELQSLHSVLYPVHKQNQLRDPEGVEMEQPQRLASLQRVAVEEQLSLVAPHRESQHLK